jgi:Glutamine synthetase adenylyltransferase
MRANIWEQNWERAVDGLHQERHLDKSDVAKLKSSYAFLRRCELVLRRYDNRSISTLPSDPENNESLPSVLAIMNLTLSVATTSLLVRRFTHSTNGITPA